MKMSPKELLYIEDALGHGTQLKTSFTDLASHISDSELKTFVEGLAKMQGESCTAFYSLLSK